jgi:hypothetical protein
MLIAVLPFRPRQSEGRRERRAGKLMADGRLCHEWTELFRDRDWNRFPPEETESFSGRVISTREGDHPSVYMRFNPYKLITERSDVIDIHCSNLEELMPFTGKDVIIRKRSGHPRGVAGRRAVL